MFRHGIILTGSGKINKKGVKELNGIKIQQIRMERGMSQSELAKAAGLTLQTIHRIENGKTPKPKKETIVAIAKALMVDVTDMDI